MAHPGGRPKSIDKDVLSKLEYAFAIGCTDREASLYANIAPSTLYRYCDEHKEFSERKEGLKKTPILKARETVVNDLENTDSAKWYLERKVKKEFSQRQELTGEDGKDITINMVSYGNHNTVPVHPEGVSATDTEGDGPGKETTDPGMAS